MPAQGLADRFRSLRTTQAVTALANGNLPRLLRSFRKLQAYKHGGRFERFLAPLRLLSSHPDRHARESVLEIPLRFLFVAMLTRGRGSSAAVIESRGTTADDLLGPDALRRTCSTTVRLAGDLPPMHHGSVADDDCSLDWFDASRGPCALCPPALGDPAIGIADYRKSSPGRGEFLDAFQFPLSASAGSGTGLWFDVFRPRISTDDSLALPCVAAWS